MFEFDLLMFYGEIVHVYSQEILLCNFLLMPLCNFSIRVVLACQNELESVFSLRVVSGELISFFLKCLFEFTSETIWTCCLFIFWRLLIIDSIYLIDEELLSISPWVILVVVSFMELVMKIVGIELFLVFLLYSFIWDQEW